MSVLAKRTYKAADERRDQILDCALRVFADKGYHGASIADVCALAGIGRATLYQYFDDKKDLLHALAERVADRISTAVTSRRPLEIPRGFVPTEEQAVAFVLHRYLDLLRVVFADADASRLILRAGRGADNLTDEVLRSIEASVTGVLERDLETSIAAGVSRPVDVKLVAQFFIGGIEKVVLSALDENRPVNLEVLAREAVMLELFGTFPRTHPVKKPRARTARAKKPKKEGRR